MCLQYASRNADLLSGSERPYSLVKEREIGRRSEGLGFSGSVVHQIGVKAACRRLAVP